MSAIARLEGFSLSSRYGDGSNLGQPLGVRSLGFVEVTLSDGRRGTGESYAGVYCPELIAPTARFLASRLARLEPEAALEKLHGPNFIPFVGSNGLLRSVASAFDIALLDLVAQRRGVPLWKLLSARARKRVPVYASGGSAAMSPEQVEVDARRAAAAGYRAYKMRVGFQSWGMDIERVARARAALGPGRALMVDAIMGTIKPPWTPAIAKGHIKELARFKPAWVEEPLPPDDPQALATLRRGSRAPIACGESWSSKAEFDAMLHAGAVDIVQPDATHCGGITPAAEACREAGRRGMRAALHVWGSPVAFLANMHVAAACAEVDYLEVPLVDLELARAMGWKTPRPKAGLLPVPSRPGLGIELPRSLRGRFPLVRGSGFVWGARARPRP